MVVKYMTDNNYISILVEDYIDFKKGLGFELKICARRLRSFVSYTRSLDYTGYISKDIALKWCCMGTDSSKTKGRRLEMLRPFLLFSPLSSTLSIATLTILKHLLFISF